MRRWFYVQGVFLSAKSSDCVQNLYCKLEREACCKIRAAKTHETTIISYQTPEAIQLMPRNLYQALTFLAGSILENTHPCNYLVARDATFPCIRTRTVSTQPRLHQKSEIFIKYGEGGGDIHTQKNKHHHKYLCLDNFLLRLVPGTILTYCLMGYSVQYLRVQDSSYHRHAVLASKRSFCLEQSKNGRKGAQGGIRKRKDQAATQA